MTPTILSLDVSSTAFGYCLLYDGAAQAHGAILLQHPDINHRCRLGRAHVAGLIALHPNLDAVAIESPVMRYGTSIPQCFVSGAIRSYIAELNIAICDIAPKEAKLALAGKGNATKEDMLRAAAPHFGYCADTLSYRRHRDVWAAWLDGCAAAEYWEHEADALGVAMASLKLVEVEAVT